MQTNLKKLEEEILNDNKITRSVKDEILYWLSRQRQEISKMVEEEISGLDSAYQGEDYRRGFNETKFKAIKIIQDKLKY